MMPHNSAEFIKSSLMPIITLISICFAVFLFLDERHAHMEDMSITDTDLRERILMSESTRYAEVAKYYTDKLKSGESLSEADKIRLDLVQRQQERIGEALKQ